MVRLAGNQLTGCLPANWQPTIWLEEIDNDFAATGLSFCETPTPEPTSGESGKQAVFPPHTTGGSSMPHTTYSGASKMYWADQWKHNIRRSNLDGSQIEVLVNLLGTNGPTGLALDVAAGKMYWTSWSPNEIQRANLDGSQVETLIKSGLTNPGSIVLDVAAGKMYWHDQDRETERGKIRRANLDGSQVEDLVRSDLSYQYSLALDVAAGKMYWTDFGTDKIRRANLDGSQIEDLVTSGLSHPLGLALDLAAGKMYWAERGTGEGGTNKIQRANLDGSQVEDLVTSGLDGPTSLALDVAAGKMYWTDIRRVGYFFPTKTGKIQRANLDGSQVEDLVTSGLESPIHIVLDVSTGPLPPGSIADDREALVALYNATGGDSWSNNRNWLTDQPLDDWYGVTTAWNGRVTRVELDSNSLSGTIPAELGNLHNLSSLFLSSNQLTGTIPAELGNLENLQYLFLAGNQLAGCVPDGLRGVQYNDLAQLGLDFCGDAPVEDHCLEALGAITAATERRGSWANDCVSANRSGSYSRYYSFTLDQRTPVQIDLSSSQNPYLYLMRDVANGTIVSRDGDGGNGSNSLITRTLDAGIPYFVEVTTHDPGQTGDFMLAVTPSGGTPLLLPGLQCMDDLGVLTGVASSTGTWASDCPANNRGDSYARYYSFELTQETQVTIDLASSLDTVVYLLDGAGTGGYVLDANDDVSGADSNSRIVATLPIGRYTVEATTFAAGVAGSFTLTVSGPGGGGPGPGGCEVVEIAADGSAVSGAWAEDCVSQTRAGSYARYYQFTLTDSANVSVVLESAAVETVLYLREGAGVTSGAHVGFNDGEEDYNYRRAVIKQTLGAGNYTIEATTYSDGVTGSFTLTVSGAGGPGGPGPGGCDVVEIAADGSAASGAWAADCVSQTRAGSYARYYQFTLTDSANVSVVLESDAAETVLYLRETAGVTSGAHIGFNEGDPEYNYRRAVIEQTLGAGTYTIEATTYSAGETGNFTLTVNRAGGTGGPGPGGCKVVEIAADGSTASGAWAADCESAERDGRYARYYQFTLTDSANVSVVLESAAAETVLYLREGAGTTFGTHIGFNEGEPDYNYHRAVIEQTLGAGTYTIEATTYSASETGNFTLTVSGAGGTGGPGPGGCDVVEIAADGSAVSGAWAADCGSQTRAGRYARYYQFTLAENANMSVVLKSAAVETVLYLREGAGVTSGEHIGFNEGEADYNYRRAVIEQTLRAGTYTIEATTYSADETGSFTLSVSGAGGGGTPPPAGGCDIADAPADGIPEPGTWSNDCQSELTAGRNARYYKFTLTEATDVTITLKADAAEPVLHLRAGESKTGTEIARHDGFASDGYKRARIEQSLEPGTYTIEARTYNEGYEGAFTLTVSGAGGVTPGECVTDLGILTKSVSRAEEWTSDCESTNQEGSYARYFRFELEYQESVRIELRSNHNTVLFLLEGGEKDGDEVTRNDDIETGVNTNSRIIHTLAAGTYLVEATTFDDGMAGFFFLDISTSDRDVLEALYNATDGKNWSRNDNWMSDAPIQFWYGVTHDGDGSVTELDLRRNGLDGEIPPRLAELNELRKLVLGENRLTGTIPGSLGDLSNLKWLSLRRNQLEGAIPGELGQLENLDVLSLNNNQLTGNIPAQLSNISVQGGSLANLRWLNLEQNLLHGTIPAGLGTLSNLEALGLGHNRLNGKIPPALSNSTFIGSSLGKLRLLYLNNQSPFRGGAQGPVLYNEQYWLAGEIPPELGSLTNLEVLNLSRNLLEGSIPSRLRQLSKLRELKLNHNRLEVPIPGDWNRLTSLEVLDLRASRLSGTIPGDLAQLENLNTLWLGGNELTGCIPQELHEVPNNDLAELGLELICTNAETDRQALLAFYEDMNGPNWEEGGKDHLFAWEGDLYRVSGSQSSWEGVWLDADNRVTHITLGANGLIDLRADRVPGRSALEHLQYLYKLESLALHENDLDTTIPESLGGLYNLESLNFYDNHLSDTIPESLGDLSELRTLNLKYNNLSGRIPSTLSRLNYLGTLLVGGNQLTGCVPVKLDRNVTANDFEELGLPSCGDAANEDFPALEALYNATGGPNWTKGGQGTDSEWNINARTGRFIEHWHGVSIATGDHHPRGNVCEGRVVALILNSNNLKGQIPESLGDGLPCLLWLELNGNELSGNIPASLGNLKSFQQDDQGQCAHSGYYLYRQRQREEDPPEAAKGQRILRLGNNDLSGPIPPSLGNLRCMTQLDLGNNATPDYTVGGRLPDRNGLEGLIPPEFANLNELIYLNLSGNKLQAGVEYVLPQSEGRVVELILGNNQWVPEYEGAFDDFAMTVAGISLGKLKGEVRNQFFKEVKELGIIAAREGDTRATVLFGKRLARYAPVVKQAITVFEGLQFVFTLGDKGSIPCGPLSCKDWYDIFFAARDVGAEIFVGIWQYYNPITCVSSVAPTTLDHDNCPVSN